MIDKLTNPEYNIRTGFEVSYTDIEKLFSKNIEKSNEVKTTLDNISGALVKVSSMFGDRCKPILAGGAVRDCLYGYTPKDYDIFVDLSFLDQEDTDYQDDFITLFTAEMCRNVVGDNYPEIIGGPYSLNVDNEGYDTVCEGHFEVHAFDFFPDNNNVSNIQIIYMSSTKHSLIDSPMEWIDDRFDYGLVKTYIDPETEKIHISKEFLENYDQKLIQVETSETCDRIRGWSERNNLNIRGFIKTHAKKNKPSSMPQMQFDRCLQHPKKWVG